MIQRKLHFVLGKGGVGKTTMAAALAGVFARRGRRTLAVEMDAAGRLPIMLGASGPVSQPEVVGRNLSVLSLDGRTALEEYLGLIIPVKRVLTTVFSSRIYQYFVAAAPGLKELMTVGKIWYEATREEGGRPVWDAIVVDAPATGHSLQYLRMPQAAREAFGVGLVQREATKITEVLRDRRTTVVHLVTLAEEMPVSETLETRAQLVGTLGLPLGYVVVNRVHRRRFEGPVLERLRGAASAGAEGALLACVAERAAEESGWADINALYLGRLRREIQDVPVVELPFLFVEEFDRRCVEQLAQVLAAGIGADTQVAGRRRGRSS
jgi:anion-transporting  ArsA/GET3 family ATPase